ncbi:hypothetical protein D3C84_411480 [compost metagenome]
MFGEHRNHHRDAHAAVGGFADADHEPRNEHLLVVLSQRATQGRHAPQESHQRQALDPTEAVGHQRQGKRQQADHQGNDATEQTQLSVAQRPLSLEQGEYRVQYLTRHVIGNQQAERQCKDDPGILARNADSTGVVIVGGDWVKGHAASSMWLFYCCYQACSRYGLRK